MSKRTVKDIEAQIKELNKEKEELLKEERAKKLEPLMEILTTTTLTVPQIKKAIQDAEKAKGKGKKTTAKKKPSAPGEPKFKRMKVCTECGKEFEAHSPRQTICPECKAKKGSKKEEIKKEEK